MKRFFVKYKEVSEDLENLIVQFAYDVNSVETLNELAVVAFLTTKQLPIPIAWKQLLLNTDDEIQMRFCWKSYLKTNLNPYSLKTHVCLSNVILTIERLNWLYLKQNSCLAASYLVGHYTKKRLLKILTRWNAGTVVLLFHIQRLLCSIEIPKALNSMARRYFNYQHFIITNPNPLSMYIHCPRLFFS